LVVRGERIPARSASAAAIPALLSPSLGRR
jgi:hypothetical protein